MDEAIVYCDGSCDKDGNGGWAAIVARPSGLLEIAGWESKTTNNRMELIAAIKGLNVLESPCAVMLASDSAYVLNSLKHEWYKDWFSRRHSKPRPNLDLWEELVALVDKFDMKYVKVQGHNGIEWNERADKLAVTARKNKVAIEHFSSEYKVHDL